MGSEKKTVEERLADLENSVQHFETKAESGEAKAEAVGAAASATGASSGAVGAAAALTGISGEATAFSSSFRLWGYDFDLKARYEANKLKNERKDPDGLVSRIEEVKTAHNGLKTNHENFVRRITPIIGPINRQFPGVKEDVARAHTRINDLSESRDRLRAERESIRQLRIDAQQAQPSLESLQEHVQTLARILGR